MKYSNERRTTLEDRTVIVERWSVTEEGTYIYWISEPVLGRRAISTETFSA